MSTNRPAVTIRFPEASGRPDLPLRLGETFEARVRNGPSGLILEISEHRLPARADVDISEGDRLLLRVTDLGHPLILQIVGHLGPRPALQSALREALPRQTPAADLIETRLQPGAGQPPTTTPLRADDPRLPTLPEMVELTTPTGLQRVVHHSGLFLEARLARGGAINADLKAETARAVERLRAQAPRDPRHPGDDASAAAHPLLEALEGLLRRIEALQARLALEAATDREWALDLPVRDGESLHALRLRARPAAGADCEAAWRLAVHLRLARLGPIYATLHLAGGRADITWWAWQRSSAEDIAAALPQLEERLVAAGLTPGAIICYHGWPTEDETAASREVARGIIDEQA